MISDQHLHHAALHSVGYEHALHLIIVQGQETALPPMHGACCRGRSEAKPDYKAVPRVVFSSPQLACVGMDEASAIEEVKDVDVYSSSST